MLNGFWAVRGACRRPSLDLKAAEHVRRGLHASAKSPVLGGLSQGKPRDGFKADRLKSRHPLQRVRHVPERDLARDEPRRVQLSARDERQELVVVGVRIALRPHHLPLPGDEVVDRDGDDRAPPAR